MDLEIGKLIDLNIFYPLDESTRQKILADHLDESRIRIAAANHRQPGFPFAPVAQTHADGAATVVHKNLFDMMHGANLPAVAHVGALQHLSDRVRAAARQLRLFIAGDQL